jgi:hypothetical protein
MLQAPNPALKMQIAVNVEGTSGGSPGVSQNSTSQKRGLRSSARSALVHGKTLRQVKSQPTPHCQAKLPQFSDIYIPP